MTHDDLTWARERLAGTRLEVLHVVTQFNRDPITHVYLTSLGSQQKALVFSNPNRQQLEKLIDALGPDLELPKPRPRRRFRRR